MRWVSLCSLNSFIVRGRETLNFKVLHRFITLSSPNKILASSSTGHDVGLSTAASSRTPLSSNLLLMLSNKACMNCVRKPLYFICWASDGCVIGTPLNAPVLENSLFIVLVFIQSLSFIARRAFNATSISGLTVMTVEFLFWRNRDSAFSVSSASFIVATSITNSQFVIFPSRPPHSALSCEEREMSVEPFLKNVTRAG